MQGVELALGHVVALPRQARRRRGGCTSGASLWATEFVLWPLPPRASACLH